MPASFFYRSLAVLLGSVALGTAALVSLPAAAGVSVDVEIVAGGSAPVSITRSYGDGVVQTPVAMVFYDPHGNRWEVLVDAAPFGEGRQSKVWMEARALDGRGREVARAAPMFLLINGREMSTPGLAAGEELEFAVKVQTTATEPGDAGPSIRRTLFARPGSTEYRFGHVDMTWTGLSCDETPFTVEFEEAATLRLHGRYRPGDTVAGMCVAETAEGSVSVPVTVAFM